MVNWYVLRSETKLPIQVPPGHSIVYSIEVGAPWFHSAGVEDSGILGLGEFWGLGFRGWGV